MSTYRIYMRGADYARLGELDSYQQFSCVQRFNDVGTWKLTAPYTARNARLIAEGGGLILTRDNTVVFSGPTASIERTASGISLSGYDDMIVLADNPAYPTPTEAGPAFTDEADIRTGIPSTLILAYVAANIGPAAVAGTYLSELTYAADPYLGATLTARARFVTLLELCQEIAWSPQGGGLRFQILQNDIASGGLLLTISQPLDRRSSILINRERGTLGAFTTHYKAPTATHVVVLGQGVGVDRVVATATDAAAEELLGRRIVRVIDKRNVDDANELQDAADAALLNAGAQRSVQIEPLATSAVVWGRDYDLGDIVTVSAGDLVMDEVVRAVELTLTAPGGVATVQPVISSPQGGDSNDSDGVAARQFTALDQRVSNVERNVRAPLAGSLTGTMLATGAAAANIGAGDISTTMLAGSAVTAAKLATDAVETGKIKDLAVTAAKIAANTITNSQMAGGAAVANLGYTPAQIASGTYTGNGATSARQVTTGFIVKMVVIHDSTNDTMYLAINTTNSIRLGPSPTFVQGSSSVHTHASDGFTVADGTAQGNVNTNTYSYTAFG